MTEVWNAVLDDLSQKVSAHNFESWFKNITLRELHGDTAYLEVADDFFKAWIEDNYLDLIEHSLHVVLGSPTEAKIGIRGAVEVLKTDRGIDAPQAAARLSRAEPTQPSLIANHSAPSAPSSWSTADAAVAAGLNPRYTFDEFVVGSSNQFVHAACAAVAMNPAQTYNPLFIFGGVGLGKTHLLQAIGLETLKRDPSARVVYLSTEEFMNQLITSLRQKDMAAFRQRFRDNCDLLLIDDIQFIGGKDATQEEFFHTFNALYNSGKQIVITSDKSPKELPGIEERLASRFAWGLTADVQTPSMETRLAILEKKAEADGIPLTKEVSLLIASAVRSNVRELEGTLIRLGAQASLTKTPMTVEYAQQMLARMNIDHSRTLTPKHIIKVVSNYFDIKPSDIKGAGRSQAISKPRQIAMYLSRKHTNASFPQLGKAFGKDHSTVITAFKKLTKIVDTNEQPLASDIAAIESTLMR